MLKNIYSRQWNSKKPDSSCKQTKLLDASQKLWHFGMAKYHSLHYQIIKLWNVGLTKSNSDHICTVIVISFLLCTAAFIRIAPVQLNNKDQNKNNKEHCFEYFQIHQNFLPSPPVFGNICFSILNVFCSPF